MNQRLITILGSSALVLVVGLSVAYMTTSGPRPDTNNPTNNGKDTGQKDNNSGQKDGPTPPSTAPWLERIVSSDAGVRKAALGQAPKDAEEAGKAITALLGKLEEADPAARTALSDLLASLGKDDSPAGMEAARALREGLASALDKEKSTSGKIVVALTLGKIGLENMAAIKPLQKAVFGMEKDLQRVAALVLRRVAQRQPGEYELPEGADPQSFSGRWLRMTHMRTTSSDDKSVIPVLIDALKDSDPGLRLWAAEVFSEEADAIQGSVDAVPALLELFQSKDEEVARMAARGLGRMSLQDGTVIAKILAALADAQVKTRQRAKEALSTAKRPMDLRGLQVSVPKELQTPEAITALSKALGDSEAEVRAQVIRTLGWIGAPAAKAIPGLVKLAGNADGAQPERLAALVALGEIAQDGATVILILQTALKEKNDAIRKAAIDALARYGKEAIPALRKALGEEDAQVQQGAILALGAIGPDAKEALAELRPLLKSEKDVLPGLAATGILLIEGSSKDVIANLKKALGEMNPVLRRTVLEAVQKVGPAATELTPEIAAVVAEENLDLSWVAADALGAIGPGAVAAVPSLVQVIQKSPDTKPNTAVFLNSPEHLTRRAIDAIRQIGPDAKAAVPALVAVLAKCPDLDAADTLTILDPTRLEGRPVLVEQASSNFDNNKETALRALGRLGPAAKDAIPALVELLTRESSLTSPVKETLIRLGPVSVPVLTKALEQKDGRFQILHTLGRMGPAARDAAPAMLKASTEGLAVEGMMQIAALGESAAGTLVEGAKDKARAIPALKALASMKEKAGGAAEALGGLLKEKTFNEKPELLRTLAAIGPAAKAATPAIREAFKDPGEEIQAAAGLALVAIENDARTAAPVLLKLVADARTDGARRDAALGLGRIPSEAEKMLPLFKNLLKESRKTLNLAGIEAIGLLGNSGVKGLPDLLKALADNDPDLQEAAAQAIASLGGGAKEAVQPLIDRAKDAAPGKEKSRRAAIIALGEFAADAKAAAPVLAQILAGGGDNTLEASERQILAARSLWQIEGKAALPVLLPSLQRLLTTLTYAPSIAEAIDVIGDLGAEGKEFVPALTTRVDAASQFLRRSSVQALGKIGPSAKASVPWLQRAAGQDADPELKQRAKDALAAIQKN